MDTSDKPLNIAHRGASSAFPENTMPAFRAAVEMNADMIELDVRISKDGVPFVLHDAALNSYSAQKGLVKDYTSKQIRSIDLSSPSNAYSDGGRISMLEEVLQFARDKIALNIEIKPEAVTDELETGVEHKCLHLVRQYDMQKRVLFSSFDLRVSRHLKQLAPDAAVAILYTSRPYRRKLPSQMVQYYNADAFHCTYHQLSYRWLKDLKANRIPVVVYTVNQASRMKRLIDLGVNGIITDKPDVLDEVINQ